MRSDGGETTNLAQIRARDFAASLYEMEFENVFNPYRHVCAIHDHQHSPSVRLNNLEVYFAEALQSMPCTAWIGRDLGYRGGRRTGLPLTDEAHLSLFSAAFNVAAARKATKTQTVAERTAAEIWRVISAIKNVPFLWNAFPFHPHEAGDDLGNRCHTRKEFSACEDFLAALMATFKFERIFVLGNDAGRALDRLGIRYTYVRHPSYGGQTEFRRQMALAYDLDLEPRRLL